MALLSWNQDRGGEGRTVTRHPPAVGGLEQQNERLSQRLSHRGSVLTLDKCKGSGTEPGRRDESAKALWQSKGLRALSLAL